MSGHRLSIIQISDAFIPWQDKGHLCCFLSATFYNGTPTKQKKTVHSKLKYIAAPSINCWRINGDER